MKSLLSFLALSLFIAMPASAQDDMEAKGADDYQFQLQSPSEGTQQMNLGSHTAFSLIFDDLDSKLVMDTWKDFIKEYKGKTKKVKRSSELFSEDVQAAILGPNNVDIYSLIERKGSGSTISIWVDQGGGFVNSSDNADGADGVEFFLNEFQKSLNVERVKIDLNEQEKELKNRERELSKLQSANDKMQKQIADWQEKIAKAEGDIETNESEQTDAEKMIQEQKDKVHAVQVKLAKAEAQ